MVGLAPRASCDAVRAGGAIVPGRVRWLCVSGSRESSRPKERPSIDQRANSRPRKEKEASLDSRHDRAARSGVFSAKALDAKEGIARRLRALLPGAIPFPGEAQAGFRDCPHRRDPSFEPVRHARKIRKFPRGSKGKEPSTRSRKVAARSSRARKGAALPLRGAPRGSAANRARECRKRGWPSTDGCFVRGRNGQQGPVPTPLRAFARAHRGRRRSS